MFARRSLNVILTFKCKRARSVWLICQCLSTIVTLCHAERTEKAIQFTINYLPGHLSRARSSSIRHSNSIWVYKLSRMFGGLRSGTHLRLSYYFGSRINRIGHLATLGLFRLTLGWTLEIGFVKERHDVLHRARRYVHAHTYTCVWTCT